MPRPFACHVGALVLLVAGSGCSSFFQEVGQAPLVQEVQRSLSLDGTETIQLLVADPQSSGTAKVHSIAVLDFAGPNKVGETMAATVAARLATQGRIEVKDRPTVQQAAVQVSQGGAGAAAAAQVGVQVGADAVLVGEVTALEQNDSAAAPPAPSVLKDLHTRQATMTLDYRLIESTTGKVLLSRRATPEVAQRSLNAFNAVEAAPSPVQVQQQLLNQAAEQIVAALSTPGKRSVERKFARSRGKVNTGNTYARQGVLDIAQQQYKEATDEDAKNHAAWYNRGLVLEAQGDYATATRHFEEAMKLCVSDLYIAAYQRARSAAGAEQAVAPAAQPATPTGGAGDTGQTVSRGVHLAMPN